MGKKLFFVNDNITDSESLSDKMTDGNSKVGLISNV